MDLVSFFFNSLYFLHDIDVFFNFKLTILFENNLLYCSTLAPFYHIRSREHAKYATVLHSKIMYWTAKSRFHRLFGRKTGKPNFDVILSGIINVLFHGLIYNTRRHFAAKYLRVLYVKPSNTMYVLPRR